jgi:ATP-dependent RNA helicase RhlE
LVDHLQQKNFTLKNISIIVLDEADRMLDIGFLPQIKQILQSAPTDRQTMLFSATMPSSIAQIANTYMKSPIRFEVSPAGTPAAHIEQGVFYVSSTEKMQLLDKLLTEIQGTILVFSRTKHGAKKITAGVSAMGHSAVEIHSNRSLAQRREALSGFKSGKYRVMVATDIASRGIDVNDITLVINYDLPDNNEDYVHRIGRTGRAGKAGRALTFATHSERMEIRQIERLIRKPLPTLAVPVLPERRVPVYVARDEERGFSGRRSFGDRSSSRGSSVGRSSSPRSSSSGRPSFGGRPQLSASRSFSGSRFRGRSAR